MEGVCIFLYNFLTVAENAWQTLESIEINGNAGRAGRLGYGSTPGGQS